MVSSSEELVVRPLFVKNAFHCESYLDTYSTMFDVQLSAVYS
jgi:hypothetical protein